MEHVIIAGPMPCWARSPSLSSHPKMMRPQPLRHSSLELPRRHAYPSSTPTRACVPLRIFLRRPRLRFPTLRTGSLLKHDLSFDLHFLVRGKRSRQTYLRQTAVLGADHTGVLHGGLCGVRSTECRREKLLSYRWIERGNEVGEASLIRVRASAQARNTR